MRIALLVTREASREEATVTLWFPAFRLRENPFKYSDAVVELSVPTVPSIEGDFLIRIGSFLEGGVSCIVVGNRGVGKSRLAAQLRCTGVSDEDPGSSGSSR